MKRVGKILQKHHAVQRAANLTPQVVKLLGGATAIRMNRSPADWQPQNSPGPGEPGRTLVAFGIRVATYPRRWR